MCKQEKKWQNLADRLKILIAILELDSTSSLAQDAIAITDFLSKTTFQIAVFAPFNHGKSTLLNALLGQKALPIDLIPSTGAAIKIKYGTKITTKITFQDGTEQIANNTKILQKYAILDDARRMRNDLQAVEVTCDYPLLKQGIELLDLPGTNDQEEQDNLVKEKLLTADLIIQVLDARKLMTLLERENLRDWLQARGIKTVVFVVNFLNLLEPEDQKKVYNRLKFVAESFRFDLPQGISNLYRVDALPALRARIKGDYHTVMETGLIELETALQTIVKAQLKQPEIKLTRITSISEKLIQAAREKQNSIKEKIKKEQQKQQQQIQIKQKAAQLIKQGLQSSISKFENWLYLPNLLQNQQAKLAIALQQNDFQNWKNEFKQIINTYQQAVIEWVTKSKDFFHIEQSLKLIIKFPELPQIAKENSTANTENNHDFEQNITAELEQVFDRAMKTILSGNGRELFTNLTKKSASESEIKQPKSCSQLYADAAENYLNAFSQTALISLKQYHKQAEQLINYQPLISKILTEEENKLYLLENNINNLQQELENINSNKI